MAGFGDPNPILPAANVGYYYRTKGSASDPIDITQLSSVAANAFSTESYGYDAEGRVSSKTLTLVNRAAYPFVTDYSYDSLDRVTDVRYPAEYGNGEQPRKFVHHDYDVASRLSQLTFDAQAQASSIPYNAASQTTSLVVGASSANPVTEGYNYNAQTGLLDNQTVARGGTTLLNLSYDYAGANGQRTGQLTRIYNNLNHNKDRGYSYDALGRLVQATGGQSGALWTQTYSYDRYGNRTSVSASGYSAKNQSRDAGSAHRERKSEPPAVAGGPSGSEPRAVATGSPNSIAKPSDPKVNLPTEELARNNPDSSGPPSSRDDSKPVSDSPPTLRPAGKDASRSARKDASAPTNAPQSGPPTFTDDPLNDPNNPEKTPIKAVHITELRTAINLLRARLGFSAFGWQQPTATGGVVQTGGLVTADPIIEMRIALDQALGPPPAPGYAGGLAQYQPILAVHIQELRNRVKDNWNAAGQIPRDGHASLSYDSTSNRITTDGFAYDAAGNQVRALAQGGGAQRFRYDAANRLVQVLADDNATVIASYTYGDSNERLVSDEGGLRTYYVWRGTCEYIESGGSTTPQCSKSYVYLGARLLSTLTPNGGGGEAIQFHHPDRLGTRLVTDPSNGTSFEQVSLPFGTALNAESTGATNRRFTSYDRSTTTGLDYAVNRHYDSQQGRFTQVDPAGMNATSLSSPQTLNLYAYCTNDPINHVDPSGLGFFSFLKKAFGVIAKIFKIVLVAAAVVAAVVGTMGLAGAFLPFAGVKFGLIMLGLSAAGFAQAFGPPWLQKILAVGFAVLGIYMMQPSIIWNFAQAATGSHALAQALGVFTTVGAVASFLQQQPGNAAQQSRLTAALDELKRRVRANKGRNPCANFFGGINKAEKALKDMEKHISFGQTSNPAAWAETVGKNTKINPNGPFMDTSGSVNIELNARGDYVTLDNAKAAAFILGHEMGHRTGKLLHDGDDPTGAISTLNNGLVYEACFSEIPYSKGPPP